MACQDSRGCPCSRFSSAQRSDESTLVGRNNEHDARHDANLVVNQRPSPYDCKTGNLHI